MIQSIIAVGVGSALGGICRYLVGLHPALKTQSGFPFHTLIVNIAGAALIGIAFALIERHSTSETWKLFITTGFLGGFTTFSTFSMDFFRLMSNGNTAYAFIYAGVTLVAGLLLTYLMYSLLK